MPPNGNGVTLGDVPALPAADPEPGAARDISTAISRAAQSAAQLQRERREEALRRAQLQLQRDIEERQRQQGARELDLAGERIEAQGERAEAEREQEERLARLRLEGQEQLARTRQRLQDASQQERQEVARQFNGAVGALGRAILDGSVDEVRENLKEAVRNDERFPALEPEDIDAAVGTAAQKVSRGGGGSEGLRALLGGGALGGRAARGRAGAVRGTAPGRTGDILGVTSGDGGQRGRRRATDATAFRLWRQMKLGDTSTGDVLGNVADLATQTDPQTALEVAQRLQDIVARQRETLGDQFDDVTGVDADDLDEQLGGLIERLEGQTEGGEEGERAGGADATPEGEEGVASNIDSIVESAQARLDRGNIGPVQLLRAIEDRWNEATREAVEQRLGLQSPAGRLGRGVGRLFRGAPVDVEDLPEISPR